MASSGPKNPFNTTPKGSKTAAALPFGIASPFYELDDLTGGFQPGSLYVVMGRKGMGHQTFALNIVGSHSRNETKPVLLLTMGEKRGPLEMEMVCSNAHVWIKPSGGATMDDDAALHRVLQAAEKIDFDKLVLFDERKYESAVVLREHVSALIRDKGVNLLVIRDLQKLQAACWKRKHGDGEFDLAADDDQERAHAALSQELKSMARELSIPVLCTVDARKGSLPPTMDDLASFGYLENDADMVLSLHRDEIRDPYSEKWGIADVRVVKHRCGPLAAFQLAYMKSHKSFENLAANTKVVIA